MKKTLSVILILIMILSSVPMMGISSFAEEIVKNYNYETVNGIEWKITDDGELFPVDKEKVVGDVVIPDKVKGITVTTIGEDAFNECKNMVSVYIPDCVKEMKYRAFQFCKSLINIRLPDNLEAISAAVFSKCTKLENIKLPDTLKEIDDYAFDNCCSLESIILPDSLTTIGINAFGFCGLKSITIPKNITVLGGAPFVRCDSLTEINLPEGLLEIKDGAFDDCQSLKEIEIPASVTTIEANPFDYCYAMENIKVSPNNKSFCVIDGCLYNKDITKLVAVPATKDSIDIPDSVTEIGDGAFNSCLKFTSLELSDNIKIIGKNAFLDCELLKNIKLSSNITTIGQSAFSGCYAIENIDIPNTVTEIKENTFSGCIGLKTFTVPNDVKKISGYAFESCRALESIIIPASVTSIGERVFYDTPLKTIYGVKGSYAETFAKENSYEFKELVVNFPDVKSTDWFSDSVDYAVEKGYFKGYADGTFGPANNIIRQDFAVVMAKAAGADLDNQSTDNLKFKDIDKNSYYAKALAWCVEKGIISGYANGNFGPADNITREQICVMVYNYMTKVKGVKDELTSSQRSSILSKYPDKNRISDWAKNAVAWSINNKVISGANGGKEVQSYAFANRAQIATIFTNMSKNGLI